MQEVNEVMPTSGERIEEMQETRSRSCGARSPMPATPTGLPSSRCPPPMPGARQPRLAAPDWPASSTSRRSLPCRARPDLDPGDLR